MKSKTNLIKKIWFYLTIFSVSILSILWFFQVIFLNAYYTWVKINDISSIASKVKEGYQSNNYEELMDILAYNQDVCIDIVRSDNEEYYSSGLNRKCISTVEAKNLYNKYVKEFMNNHMITGSYKITDNRFENKVLVTGIKLEDNYYAFISTTLEPLTSTTKILISQLIYVTILVLCLSFLIAYFVSKKISGPMIEINKKAKRMSKGDYQFSFKTDSNISEIVELTTTLDEAKDELEKTDDLRRELLANVSHDLKTPLTMIKAYAEMVRDITYKDKEKRESNLNTIIEETDRLTLLVNDILDLSKLGSVVEIKCEDFDLNQMIRTIMKRFECFEDIKFVYGNEKTLMVHADITKMEQVIYNLVGNAINYVGKDKKVMIQIIENKSTYTVEVIDHGKGIKKEELDKIWDKYYKIDKTHQRNQFGTGIGLSIVKEILKNHNFNYGVKSELKKGTTFYFEIKKA